MIRRRVRRILRRDDRGVKIETYVVEKGVTRCPTACVAETQGCPAPSDREALEQYAALREEQRHRRLAASRSRALSALGLLPLTEE